VEARDGAAEYPWPGNGWGASQEAFPGLPGRNLDQPTSATSSTSRRGREFEKVSARIWSKTPSSHRSTDKGWTQATGACAIWAAGKPLGVVTQVPPGFRQVHPGPGRRGGLLGLRKARRGEAASRDPNQVKPADYRAATAGKGPGRDSAPRTYFGSEPRFWAGSARKPTCKVRPVCSPVLLHLCRFNGGGP